MQVAIVEDEQQAANRLEQFFVRYAAQNKKEIHTETFFDPLPFANQYKPVYDLIMLDIRMPNINGINLAEEIRDQDDQVIIVFVTNMAQYAVKGYKVDALDFILKPITYYQFSMTLDKVFRCLSHRDSLSLIMTSKRKTFRINVNEIQYIESHNHKLYFYLDDRELEVWSTLSAVEESLPTGTFSKINAGTLVNLQKVTSVQQDSVLLNDTELPLSRRRKKEFCADLAHYYGEKKYV